ncbi:phosphate/phosphonate ABC transporter permease [Spiroplasma endosymbiont of Dasysyrphus albostriatus]|uniref:PhnE/PtxC family ABC transporter permease n=1 Tax=Spiroplasma endosymbiont of Dasysyrphus albostriatus TaxID=3066299 RepID=UPI0030CFB720
MIRKLSGLTSKKPFVINNHHSSPPKKIFFWSFLIVVITLVIIAFNFINPDWNEFFSGFSTLGDRIKQLINLNFSEFNSVPFPDIEPHSFMYLSFASIWQTFIMTFAGTIIGTTIALPVAIFASKNIFHNKIINGILKTILAIFRTIPAFVFSLLFVGIFGPNMLTVTVAIIIFTFGMTAKMIYDRIEQIDMGPYEVLSATGANKFTCFQAAAFPQVMKHIVSTWWYALEVNIRYSAIIGLVAKVGIGSMIKNKIDSKQWPQVGWLLFLLIITIVIIELASFITKKWIMNDNDKILDKKQLQKFTKKTILLNKLPNFFYWKTQIILSDWKQQNRELKLKLQNTNNISERNDIIKQLNYLKTQKKVILKTKVKELKNNIKNDKLVFKNAKLNNQDTYIFDQQLLQKIRLDKVSKIHYQVMITNTKLTTLKEKQNLANEYHQQFKNNLTVNEVYKRKPLSYIKRIIFVIIILGFFIYSFSQIDFVLANNAQISDTWQHIKDMFNISWSSLFTTTGWNGNSIPFSVVYLIFETIMIAIVGTFLGFICAFILGMLSSNKVTNKYIANFFWMIATIIRPIPSYIYAIILISLVGLGPFTGALALAIATTGMLSKYIRESFNDIDTTILETLTASGANYLQRFRYGILPQVSANIVSWGIYRFSINITEAAILGVVGAGNFGFVLSGYWTGSYYHEFGALLFGMIFITVILELIINMLRNKIKNGLDPRFIYKFNKLIKRYQSPWYVINGRVLDKNTVSMSFEELKALFKYTNVIIFRTSFKKWIKQCYKFKSKSRISWSETYANNYCHYFNLTTDNSIITMKEHNLQYVAAVRNLIESRKKYLKKSAKNNVLKIKTLKKEYKIASKKLKKDYKLLKIKLNNEIMQLKKINNTLNTNEQYNNKLRIDNLKKEYGFLLKKNKNDQKILKVDFNNDINIVKNLWKSVKLRHE